MKRIARFVWISLVVLGVGALYFVFSKSGLFTLENIKLNASAFKARVDQNYGHAVGLFIAICTGLIMLTLPITAPMGVLAGFLFGLWPGVLYSMISIILGAGISFLVVRYALSHAMKNKYGERLGAFNESMKQYGYTYLITLQLLTVIPYFIINTLAALAGVPFLMFLFTTVVGSFPIVVIYTFAGKQLFYINSWKDILSTQMLLVLLLLGAIALLPMLLQKWKQHTKGSDENDARK